MVFLLRFWLKKIKKSFNLVYLRFINEKLGSMRVIFFGKKADRIMR